MKFLAHCFMLMSTYTVQIIKSRTHLCAVFGIAIPEVKVVRGQMTALPRHLARMTVLIMRLTSRTYVKYVAS